MRSNRKRSLGADGWWGQRNRVALVVLLMLWIGTENRVFAQENSKPMAETLIMQTSPTKVEQSDGVFVVEVSAFEPFLVVKVNGFAQMVLPEADWQVFEVPYQLKPGDNEFVVFVQTKNSEKQESFTVTYTTQEMKEEKQKIDPLSLAFVLGYTQSDNMLQANALTPKKPAARLDAVLISGYRYKLLENAGVSLKFLLKADRQLDRSLSHRETGYRKLALEYDHQRLWGTNLTTGLGQSVFSLKSTDTSKPSTLGEFQASTRSVFLFAGVDVPFAGNYVASAKLQLDLQTGQSADNAGTVTSSDLGLRMRFGGFSTKVGADQKSGAFKDASNNTSSSTAKASARMTWGGWTPHVSYQSYNQKYLQPNAVTGLQVQNRRNTSSFGVKYRWSESLLLDLYAKQIKVSSNEALNAYSENQVGLQMMWSY